MSKSAFYSGEKERKSTRTGLRAHNIEIKQLYLWSQIHRLLRKERGALACVRIFFPLQKHTDSSRIVEKNDPLFFYVPFSRLFRGCALLMRERERKKASFLSDATPRFLSCPCVCACKERENRCTGSARTKNVLSFCKKRGEREKV